MELVVHIITNFFDFVMLYYLCKNFTRYEIQFFSLKSEKLALFGQTIKLPAIVFASIYGLVLGISFQVLDGYSFRVISNFMALLCILLISKRKLADTLLIYAIFLFFSILIVQIPLSLFGLLVGLPVQEDFAITLTLQLLTTLLVGWLCCKINIYKVFNYIRTNILVKTLCFLASLLVVIVMFVIDYENNIAHFIFFIGLTFIILIALIPIGIKLYQRVEVDVTRSHYIANQILATQIAAAQTNDLDEIKKMIDELVSHISPKSTKKANTGNLEENIRFLIEQKQERIVANVITDIKSLENHENIKIKQLLSFVGLLLDNAFEEETTKPIIIYCRMNAYSLDLVIANEYLPRNSNDLEIMFEKGYSTKADEGRGYGLYELRKEIEGLNGKIEAFIQYFDKYNETTLEADYLVFRIQFWN